MSADEAQSKHAERMVEAFLAGEPPARDVRDAIGGDAELQRLENDLRDLAGELAAVPAPAPDAAVVARAIHAARTELATTRSARELAREWARLLGAATATLPLVIAWNAAVLLLLPPLLGRWLPEGLASGLPALYVFGAAGWLAVLLLSLPALAHRSLARRNREALP